MQQTQIKQYFNQTTFSDNLFAVTLRILFNFSIQLSVVPAVVYFSSSTPV